jgi:redox-sensitive bicupin YhaK (pirin superfamily)
MFTVRRASERYHHRTSRQEAWFTFEPQDKTEPYAGDFGTLEQLNELRIAPGTSAPRNTRRDVEVVTYVYQGVLAYEDSMGHSGVLQAGEFHRVTSGRSLRHSKMNASRTDWAHFYQLWLRPSEIELESEHVQKRFSAAERRGGLCLVASPDARRGSLRIHEDAQICSALLEPGKHVVRELLPGRSAWLHVVQGEVTLGDAVLTGGDGAGITDERAVSLTAREKSEILLVDVVALPTAFSTRSGRP